MTEAIKPSLYLHKFSFILEALEDMYLPEYKGSAFRGAFGWAFRNSVCIVRNPECRGCLLLSQCSYFRIFETEIPDNDIWFLKGVRKVPHPFIIHPPLDAKRETKKGESIKVGLTIIGSAISFLPYFVYTFQQMGNLGLGYQRKKFRLKSVLSQDASGAEHSIFEESTNTLRQDYSRIDIPHSTDIPDENINRAGIKFLTPARLQRNGTVIANPANLDLKLFISLLERRYFTLSHLFCNNKFENIPAFIVTDEMQITHNDLYFHDWERYSTRQNRKIDMGGFMGSFTIEGNIHNLLPLLRTGEKINVGKNTIFGLGEYKLELN